MTLDFFGFDQWMTDIPENVEGPMAGVAEYVKLLGEHGSHPMLNIQALALVLGQQIALLVEGADDQQGAFADVIAEACGIATIEASKLFTASTVIH